MHLTVLAVPDCPNAPVLNDRLGSVADGRAGVSVSLEVVCDEGEAAERRLSEVHFGEAQVRGRFCVVDMSLTKAKEHQREGD